MGFNCLGFDLPVLLRRSLYLEMPAPSFSLNKYRPSSIVDLMQLLAYPGTLMYRSLGFVGTAWASGSLGFSAATIHGYSIDHRHRFGPDPHNPLVNRTELSRNFCP